MRADYGFIRVRAAGQIPIISKADKPSPVAIWHRHFEQRIWMMSRKSKWIVAPTMAAFIAGGFIALDQVAGTKLMNKIGSGENAAHAKATQPDVMANERIVMAQQQAAPPTAASAPAAPSVSRRTETTTYDAWVLTCTSTMEKGGKSVCSGMLRVIERKQNQVLFAWVIGRDEKGKLRSVMETPTGVLIQKGVELKLGKSPMRTLPYTACRPQQCDASTLMDEAFVRDAAASSEAVATIFAIDGRNINFNLNVKGIDKVLAAIGR